MDIIAIKHTDTLDLRQAVLRPHQKASELIYSGDTDDTSLHFGALVEEAIMGVISLYRTHCPNPNFSQPSYRIRGMAVRTQAQGQGIGAALLRHGEAKCLEKGANSIWCNGRVTASDFYLKHGYTKSGEPFEIEGIGLHYIMYKDLKAK